MNIPVIKIETDVIANWDSFHDFFVRSFNFPDYYGRNMNAWIDCISDHTAPFVLQLDNAASFRARCPEQYAAIVECSSFVNWRNVESGFEPLIYLAFSD
ncbi:MAG: barnase inhibitor [Pirellulaceae bacterium]|nr:barnase inhibitor [Pirellulaceae bacterium]